MKIAPLSTTKFRARPYEPRDREAILEIEKKRHAEWLEKGANIPYGDPNDPLWVSIVVVVDGNDKVVAALGAKRVVEIGSTVDASSMSHELRDGLMRAWAKLVASTRREGYDLAYCRVGSPTPGWARMLEKRAGFVRSHDPQYFFDLEAALPAPKSNA